MVELVDTPVLEAGLARGGGSSPSRGTKIYYHALMLELVDMAGSNSAAVKSVGVRVPLGAPNAFVVELVYTTV